VLEPLYQIVFFLRFLCFIAVIYLALHVIVARLSMRPNSRLLWFFSVVTAPLIRPVRIWIMPKIAEKRLLSAALLFYFLLWVVFVVADKILAVKPA